MKKTLLLLILPLAAFGQQDFSFSYAAVQGIDCSSLDGLGANAKSSTKVTLDGSTLGMAAGILGTDDGKDSQGIPSIARRIKMVCVRSFDFERAGQYKEADLALLRTYIANLKWHQIVDTKDKDSSTEVYVNPLAGDTFGGLAVISVEPKEVTVIFIDGTFNMSDLRKLGGNMGIPDGIPGVSGGDARPKSRENKKAPPTN